VKQLYIFTISKQKAGSKALSKLYYPKVAASEKATSGFHPFGWLLAFWKQKQLPKAQPKAPKECGVS